MDRLLHDVKTPLATIRALSQLTATQLKARGDDVLAARLQKVDAQVDRIRAMVQTAVEERRGTIDRDAASGGPGATEASEGAGGGAHP